MCKLETRLFGDERIDATYEEVDCCGNCIHNESFACYLGDTWCGFFKCYIDSWGKCQYWDAGDDLEHGSSNPTPEEIDDAMLNVMAGRFIAFAKLGKE